MPTTDEFWAAAADVVTERGYLVIGFSEGSEQPELGSKLDNVLGFKPQRSVMIVGHSNWMDWKEQVETFHRLRPAWGRGKIGDPNGRYYRARFGELAVPNSQVVPSVTSPDLPPSPVPSFSGYAVQAVPEGLMGEPFWPRAVARIVDYVFLSLVIARFAGSLFRFLLTTAAGGRPAPLGSGAVLAASPAAILCESGRLFCLSDYLHNRSRQHAGQAVALPPSGSR